MVHLTLLAAGTPILLIALRANLRTSLVHALIWALAAWIAWGVAFAVGDLDGVVLNPFRYVALCLTGCAGVAVLGARRPHALAWNLVVLGLFAVMVLPLLETAFLGTHPVDVVRIVFLAGTLAVGIVNYLPTRMGPAAFAVLMACGAGMVNLFLPEMLSPPVRFFFDGLLIAAPWLGLAFRARTKGSDGDLVWRRFRDSWGLVWGQRVREQFNRATENAGLPVSLHWRGLVGNTEKDEGTATLRAILQRFLEPGDQ